VTAARHRRSADARAASDRAPAAGRRRLARCSVRHVSGWRTTPVAPGLPSWSLEDRVELLEAPDPDAAM